MKKSLFLILFAVINILSATAQKAEIYTVNGKAIRGYDAVAFFNVSQPVKGDERFSLVWKEATWLFSSKENLEQFTNNPEKFTPQYGGYCAYGMSNGYKAPTATETWKILDNKLYFNYNLKVQELWNKDQNGYIQKADKNWVKVKNE